MTSARLQHLVVLSLAVKLLLVAVLAVQCQPPHGLPAAVRVGAR